MDREQEEKVMAMAAEQARSLGTMNQNAAGTATGGGGIGGCVGKHEVAQPSLRERIYSQRRHAQTESKRLDQLTELQFLLDSNPEIARILELLESVKG